MGVGTPIDILGRRAARRRYVRLRSAHAQRPHGTDFHVRGRPEYQKCAVCGRLHAARSAVRLRRMSESYPRLCAASFLCERDTWVTPDHLSQSRFLSSPDARHSRRDTCRNLCGVPGRRSCSNTMPLPNRRRKRTKMSELTNNITIPTLGTTEKENAAILSPNTATLTQTIETLENAAPPVKTNGNANGNARAALSTPTRDSLPPEAQAEMRQVTLRDVRHNEKVRAYIEMANAQMAVIGYSGTRSAPCRTGCRDCPQHLPRTWLRHAHGGTRGDCGLSARHRQLRPPDISPADRRNDGDAVTGIKCIWMPAKSRWSSGR